MLTIITTEGDDVYEYWREGAGEYLTLHLSMIQSDGRTERLRRDGYVVALALLHLQGKIPINPFLILASLGDVKDLVDLHFVKDILQADPTVERLGHWPLNSTDEIAEGSISIIQLMAAAAMPDEMVSIAVQRLL